MLAIIQYGLSVAAVGVSIVFIGLVILIGLIKGMEICINGTSKKTVSAPAPAPVPAAAPAEAVEEEVADDSELIAVIAAAVAAAMEAEGVEDASGFVVRSIRRVNNAPAWNRAGREEQVYSRM